MKVLLTVVPIVLGFLTMNVTIQPPVESIYLQNLDTFTVSANYINPQKQFLIDMVYRVKIKTDNPVDVLLLAEWIYLVGCAESGYKTTSKYEHGSDQGIWQFNAITRKHLTGSTRNITSWSYEDQVLLYEEFLLETKKFGKVRNLGDIYALNWLPARFHRTVLSKKGDRYYLKGRKDVNKDGKIDRNDLIKMLLRRTRKCTPFIQW